MPSGPVPEGHKQGLPAIELRKIEIGDIAQADQMESHGLVGLTLCRSAASPSHERFVDVTPISLRRVRQSATAWLAIAKFEPTTPRPRIAAAMKAGNHHDALWIDSIQKPKGKPTNRRATNVPVENLVGLGQFGDRVCSMGSCTKELSAEARSSSLIPTVRVSQIGLGCWPKNDRLHREEPMRRTASSQAVPVGPSRSRSSRRPSSSSRCAGVKGSKLAAEPMLSQSLPIRSKRSSVLRRSTSIAGMAMNVVFHTASVLPTYTP